MTFMPMLVMFLAKLSSQLKAALTQGLNIGQWAVMDPGDAGERPLRQWSMPGRPWTLVE